VSRFDERTTYDTSSGPEDCPCDGALGLVLSGHRGRAQILASFNFCRHEGAPRRRRAYSFGADLRATISARAPGLVDASGSLGFLGMFHAAEFVSPGLATVIANTQPLLAAVLAAFWLGEKLSLIGSIGLFAGFAGIVLIALPDFLADGNESYVIGVLYIILAAAGVTLSNVLIKSIAGKVDSLSAMGVQMLLGSVPLVIAAVSMEEPTTINWTPVFIASLLVLAMAGSALVYWLWFSALETVPLNRANAFSFLIPVFGLTLGIIIYGEWLSVLQIAGIVMIFLGIAMVHCGKERTLNEV